MNAVKNCYPELPEMPYKQEAIAEADVVAHIHTLPFNTEAKRTTFTVSFNETGGFKALVNNNAAGLQGDNARWRHSWDGVIKATTVKNENMTGNARRFLVFDRWQSSIDMLAFYMNSRGIYVGGNAKDFANINPVGPARQDQVTGKPLATDLYTAYYRGWVIGDIKAAPRKPDIADFTLLYLKSQTIFV